MQQIIPIIAPIVTYLIDLIFVKNELIIDGRLMPGNPMANIALGVGIVCLIFSFADLVRGKNRLLSIIGIVLNVLLILLSVY